ncbi:MAG TPA: hypothetical protein V6C95_17120, partial [Coleofasciculaceae cyanobacterium]
MHKQKREENASFSRFYMEMKVAKTTCNYQLFRVNCLQNLASITQLLQESLFAAFTTWLNSTRTSSTR